MMDPTTDQVEHGRLVEMEAVELIARLQAEGIDFRVVMAGMATATARAMLATWGGKAVPVWFVRQAAMTMHFADEG